MADGLPSFRPAPAGIFSPRISMTKRWSSCTSDLTKTKRQASKELRSFEKRLLREQEPLGRNSKPCCTTIYGSCTLDECPRRAQADPRPRPPVPGNRHQHLRAVADRAPDQGVPASHPARHDRLARARFAGRTSIFSAAGRMPSRWRTSRRRILWLPSRRSRSSLSSPRRAMTPRVWPSTARSPSGPRAWTWTRSPAWRRCPTCRSTRSGRC